MIRANIRNLNNKREDMRGRVHYRNRFLCRVSKTLGKGYFTLGKYFIGKWFFVEYFFWFAECRKGLGKLRIEKIQKNIKTFFKL
jgi:hypothetical protein